MLSNQALGKSSTSDSNDITSEQFNNYFASIGSKLADKFDTCLPSCPPADSIYTFRFNSITLSDVFRPKELSLLSSQPKLDILDFDSYLLHISAQSIAKPLTCIFNQSCETGHVPDDFKKARVTPIFKKCGSVNEYTNYRPISVVSYVAKVFEKIIYKQLLAYMHEHDFFSIDQSAFLTNHSTQTSLQRVNDDFLENIDDKNITLVCCFDLKKCFDSIIHSVLLKKLRKYGITNTEHSWFKSYLTNRSQATFYQNKLSSFTNIHTGIPQGSILGPLIFLIFINDIQNIPHRCKINLYADDILLYSCDEDINIASSILQEDVNRILKWFQDNKLTVNVQKTFLIPFASPHRIKSIKSCPVICANNSKLEWKFECKYLGVILDSCLTWKPHIEYMCNELRPKIGLLSRLRHILPRKELCMIYMTLIQSIIDYGITLWGFSSKANVAQIARFQKRCARLITGQFNYTISSQLLLNELNLLNIEDRIQYFISIAIFKCLLKLAPYYLQDKLTLCNELHDYLTRDTTLLSIPQARTNYMKRSFAFQGPSLWNSLPPPIRSLNLSVPQFKSQLKRYLLNNGNL